MDMPPIQTKLTVNQPGDRYELEADRVAEQVMRMPETSSSPPGVLQRQSAENDEDEETLQAKASPGQTPQVTPELQTRISSLRGEGQPLSDSIRTFMEPRFGHDFSKVRIHTDAQAVETASAVNARAYTLGRDIVFGAGQYRPGTSEGKRLLAHELTHIVQHGSSNHRRGVMFRQEDAGIVEDAGVSEGAKDASSTDAGLQTPSPASQAESSVCPPVTSCPNVPVPELQHTPTDCSQPGSNKDLLQTFKLSDNVFSEDMKHVKCFIEQLASCLAEVEHKKEMEGIEQKAIKGTKGETRRERKEMIEQAMGTIPMRILQEVTHARILQEVNNDFQSHMQIVIKEQHKNLQKNMSMIEQEVLKRSTKKEKRSKNKSSSTSPTIQDIKVIVDQERCKKRDKSIDMIRKYMRAWMYGRIEKAKKLAGENLKAQKIAPLRTVLTEERIRLPKISKDIEEEIKKRTKMKQTSTKVKTPKSGKPREEKPATIAPEVANFLIELRKLHKNFSASTYSGHGEGSWKGQGFSLDLTLTGKDAETDERGFYKLETAKNFLRHIRDAAEVVKAEWRVLYDDDDVAKAINKETGKKNVSYMAEVFKGKEELNWHGPAPLKLHFHLDIAPAVQVQAQQLSAEFLVQAKEIREIYGANPQGAKLEELLDNISLFILTSQLQDQRVLQTIHSALIKETNPEVAEKIMRRITGLEGSSK